MNIYIYIVGNIYVGNNKREWLRKKSNLVYTQLFAVLFAILISLCKVSIVLIEDMLLWLSSFLTSFG